MSFAACHSLVQPPDRGRNLLIIFKHDGLNFRMITVLHCYKLSLNDKKKLSPGRSVNLFHLTVVLITDMTPFFHFFNEYQIY